MPDDTITTGVDALLELLKSTEKIAMPDAAKKLNVPLDTLQSWVDFLVEERIIGDIHSWDTESGWVSLQNRRTP